MLFVAFLRELGKCDFLPSLIISSLQKTNPYQRETFPLGALVCLKRILIHVVENGPAFAAPSPKGKDKEGEKTKQNRNVSDRLKTEP